MHILFPVFHLVFLTKTSEHVLQIIVFLGESWQRCVFKPIFIGVKEHSIGEGENNRDTDNHYWNDRTESVHLVRKIQLQELNINIGPYEVKIDVCCSIDLKETLKVKSDKGIKIETLLKVLNLFAPLEKIMMIVITFCTWFWGCAWGPESLEEL